MHNYDSFVGLLIGFIVGGFFTIGFAVNFPGTIIYKAITAKEECQTSFPRDQYCIINAIPQEK